MVICLNKQTREVAAQNLCVSSRRPPQLLQDCKTQPCPPRYGNPHSGTKTRLIQTLFEIVRALNRLDSVKICRECVFGERVWPLQTVIKYRTEIWLCASLVCQDFNLLKYAIYGAVSCMYRFLGP